MSHFKREVVDKKEKEEGGGPLPFILFPPSPLPWEELSLLSRKFAG